ncbi:MAG TPA: sugar phosphate nucleotidyltransferase, partial [Dehalococcoidia bacterium]|nr:sugar phosphate nucleotidyltransferase [Dehalococcoidia bacterium]
MPAPKVLALVLAGGEGGRLGPLTERRAKPAVPFGGVYRLIDFALSNCQHSGLSDVWILEQYQPHTLNDHLANGRPWDLDRTYGGLQLLPPYIAGRSETETQGGFAHGNADAIYRQIDRIRAFGPDVLLVLSADHVYQFDYWAAIDRHREANADLTMVTTRVQRDEASRFGLVEVDDQGKVTGYWYKPETPPSDLATTEVFIFDPGRLIEGLEELAAGRRDDSGEAGLRDLGHAL